MNVTSIIQTTILGKLLLLETHRNILRTMDGWMICDFTSLSTVFESYSGGGGGGGDWMMMKGCAMEPRLLLERFPFQAGLGPRTARAIGQHFIYKLRNKTAQVSKFGPEVIKKFMLNSPEHGFFSWSLMLKCQQLLALEHFMSRKE